MKPMVKALRFVMSLSFFFVPASAAAQNEWLTWGHDQQRTGWNQSETTLTKENVSHLELKWKTQLPTPPREVVLSTLTAPLVAMVNGPQGPVTRVFVAGSDNTVYAVDAETGAISWQRPFPNAATPSVAPDYRCPSTLNATPVIDKEAGIIYVSTSDGKLRGLSLVDGKDRMEPTDFTTPFARNWSLNLIDGVIYSPTARGCLGIPSHFTAINVKDPARHRQEFFTGTGVPAGAWGRGGLVGGPKYIFAQTADGPYDPAGGKFGNTVMALTFKDLRLVDSFTAENYEYLNKMDLDLGSASPVIFRFERWTLLASAGKESVIYLLDADNLGSANHQTGLYRSPRWGNDEALLQNRGIWGAMATWQDAQGRRYLATSMLGPVSKSAPSFKYTNGSAADGSVMAFEVRLDAVTAKPALVPLWVSRELHAPDVPVVANGVVYAFQSGKNHTEARAGGRRARPAAASLRMPNEPSHATKAILFAFDAETGKELFSSELDSFNHFTNPVVAGGTVYAVDWDGKLYAFGLKK
jgi:outer membrane protein assembly factor BamB